MHHDRLPVAYDGLTCGTCLDGRFQVQRLIARTALSAVYAGSDIRSGRPVAIKRFAPTAEAGCIALDWAMRAFAYEAYVLLMVPHPNLPRLYAYRSHGRERYMVMEYLDGVTLADLLRTRTLTRCAVRTIIDDLCTTLRDLHTHHPAVIHADLKPANIMRTHTGRTVLIDFGLARLTDPATSQPIGTPGYAPPEQLAGAPLDARSDVYALGRVVADMLPWMDRRHHLVPVLTTALAPAREQRYASVQAFHTALHTALHPPHQRVLTSMVRTTWMMIATMLLAALVLTSSQQMPSAAPPWAPSAPIGASTTP